MYENVQVRWSENRAAKSKKKKTLSLTNLHTKFALKKRENLNNVQNMQKNEQIKKLTQ